MMRGPVRTMLSVLALVVLMGGLSFASVPFYRWFCQQTGFGGTTQRAEAAPGTVGARWITVRFDANTQSELGWEFAPDQLSVKVRVGEPETITYHARNRAAVPATGTATFNVTPEKAAVYFDKIACFCFSEQHLKAGERVEMPVTFFIDPDIVKDHSLDDVDTVTLSYTMFRAKTQEPQPKPAQSAGPTGQPAAAASRS